MKKIRPPKYGRSYPHPRHYQLDVNDLDNELFEILEHKKSVHIRTEEIRTKKK